MGDRNGLTHEALAARARGMLEDNRARRAQERPDLPPPNTWRFIRSGCGLSQRQVAELIDASPAAISRWESGVHVPREVLAERYALVLRVMSELAIERGRELPPQRDAEPCASVQRDVHRVIKRGDGPSGMGWS